MSEPIAQEKQSGITSYIIRFILVSVILVITSYLTPGFSIVGLWSVLIAAVAIIILDYLAERIIKIDASPFGKGIKGFIISAVILFSIQYIVPNMSVSIIGAILASIVIGILDAIIPGRAM